MNSKSTCHLRAVLWGLMLLALPSAALAATGPIEETLCGVAALLNGSTGKIVATLAVLSLGLAALFGKIEWKMALIVVSGIALLLGAVSIMSVFGWDSSGCAAPSATPAATFSCSNGQATGNLFSVVTMNPGDPLYTATNPTPVDGSQPAADNGGGAAGADSCDNLGVFGQVLCYFKETVGQTMSTMYCSFQAALMKPLDIAMTLFVVIFGILVTTGIVHLTVKEAMTALFKIALVWGFASNADWAIGIGFKFFMGFAQEGANIALSVLTPAGGNSSGPVGLSQLDCSIANMFGTMSGTSGNAASSCSNAANTLPSLPTTLSDYCKAMLAGLAALMVFFLPIVAVFTTSIVLQYIMLFARAMLGYLTVMVLISFLFIISPLMFSFALFKATRQIFEQWIRYLTTFSLQLVLVFAFLAMLQLVLSPLAIFLTGVLGLVREYDVTWSKQYTSAPVHMCSICEYSPNPISLQGSVLSMTTFPVTCGGGAGTDGVQATGGSSDYVIPLGNLLQHNDLIVFLLSQTIALLLIFSVMKDFMEKAPELAKQIGGVPNAPSITGGTPDNPSTLNYPGVSGAEKSVKDTMEGLVGNRPTPK